jgi:hypothetical protein
MANEEKRVLGSPVTLEAAGTAITDAAIGQANDADYDFTSTGDYPHAKFTLSAATWAGNPTEMSTIEIVVQSLNVDSTTDTPAPTATYRHLIVGRFVIKGGATTAATYECYAYNVPRAGTVWLYNATGQTLATNWVLKVTPFTYAPT